MPDDLDWLIVGDFNFCRQPSDINKLGGDVNGMLLFNEAINNLGLIELPLKGRKFTWSNMQKDPLLERLDCFLLLLPGLRVFPQLLLLLLQSLSLTIFLVSFPLAQ